MSAVLVEHPQWEAITGVPIVSGSVYIGVQGLNPISNPKAIFSDRALQISIINPQLTGADGRTVNKIWTDGAFSIIVHNSLAVQVFQDLDAGGAEISGVQALINVAGVDTITAQGAITIATLIDKELYAFEATGNNTGSPVTLQIDSTPVTPVTSKGGLPLSQNAIVGGTLVYLGFNASIPRFELVSGADLTQQVTENELALVALQIGNMIENTTITPLADLRAAIYFENVWGVVGDYNTTNAEFFFSSDDGENWSIMSSGNPNVIGDLFFLTGCGTRVIAGGEDDGVDAKLLWANGITGPWSPIANPEQITLRTGAEGGAECVMLGDATGTGNGTYILSTADPSGGVTQRIAPADFDIIQVQWSGVAYVAVGENDGAQGYMIRSLDGITWAQVDLTGLSLANLIFSGILVGNGYLLALGSNSGVGVLLQSFDDGVSWTDISSQLPVAGVLDRPGFHGGENVFIMKIGGIFYVTPDAITWRIVNSGSSLNLVQDVVYGNGRVVMPDSTGAGEILVSLLFL